MTKAKPCCVAAVHAHCCRCTCPPKSVPTPSLEEVLDQIARDYREMAFGFGPVVPDEAACWRMAEVVEAFAKFMRLEVAHQLTLAGTGNAYSECVVQVLDRVRGVA